MAYDLAPIQDAINSLYSVVVTNQSSFGVQNILIPKGCDLTPSQIMDGLNLITYDAQFGKPESMNLTNTPAEIFNFISRLESIMETISGVNSVARGNPEPSLKSGSALALVQSMAIQFISGLQQSYTNLLEGVGVGLINILKSNATTPRMIEISGKKNRSYTKEFINTDLSNINRVVVDVGNPLSRTSSGRVQMAENLLQYMPDKINPMQYLNVINTGQLEPLTEEIKDLLTTDVTDICNSDPRVYPSQIKINEYEQGYLIEITLNLKNTDQSDVMQLAFDQRLGLSVQ
jgi:hypothetical protein